MPGRQKADWSIYADLRRHGQFHAVPVRIWNDVSALLLVVDIAFALAGAEHAILAAWLFPVDDQLLFPSDIESLDMQPLNNYQTKLISHGSLC